jgi:hypothetical protein
MDKYDNEFSLAECLKIVANPVSFYNFVIDGLKFLKEFKRIINGGG